MKQMTRIRRSTFGVGFMLVIVLVVELYVNFMNMNNNIPSKVVVGALDVPYYVVEEKLANNMNRVTTSKYQGCSRLRHIKKMCMNLENNITDLTSPVHYGHLVADDKHKVIFCYLPKVASTALKKFMVLRTTSEKELGMTLSQRPGLVVNKRWLKKHGLIPMDLLNMAAIRHRLKSYYKFMIVRHPFERLYSAYNDKFVKNFKRFGKRWYGDVIKKTLEEDWNEDVEFLTFEQFAKVMLDGGNWFRSDEHWAPQHSLCHPCSIQYDYVARMETMKSDLPSFLDQFKASETDMSFVNSANQVEYPAGYHKLSIHEAFGQLGEKTKLSLMALYRMDFNIFGYDWSRQNGSQCRISMNSEKCC